MCREKVCLTSSLNAGIFRGVETVSKVGSIGVGIVQ